MDSSNDRHRKASLKVLYDALANVPINHSENSLDNLLSSLNNHTLYSDCIDAWGFEAQERQAIEEMAELIQALNKMWRKDSRKNEKNVREEIADVLLTVMQLAYLYGYDNVTDIVRRKAQKVTKKLEKNNANI